MACLKIVFGTSFVGKKEDYKNPDAVEKALDVLQKNGVKNLDTAQRYGSEALLGTVKAGTRFTIDTKDLGGTVKGAATRDAIVSRAKESMQKLGVEKVDILYLHAPDPDTPISETLAGINDVHQAGLFSRFGLSNFSPEEVEEVYEHCKYSGYVLPSAFQGNYNAVDRVYETTLFPMLRKYDMAFYAYSPIAGGFLARSKQQILDGEGRFNKETSPGFFVNTYLKSPLVEALDEWSNIAESEGCSKAELAYRWVAYNSTLSNEKGDAMIIGASSLGQLVQTLDGLKNGPLKPKNAARIEDMWRKIEKDASMDKTSEL